MPLIETTLRAVLLCLLAVALTACSDASADRLADRLYALKLSSSPTEVEWQRALPRVVLVRGGRPHKLPSFAEIDEDTVHVTTASCHHGSRLPDPIRVDIRAFYTDGDLYLRLAWKDATPDQALMDWEYDGVAWKNNGGQEDGFGLMWDTIGQFPQFTCSYACHIKDFGVNRSNFHASNKMRLAKEGTGLDLWNWKAGRTAPYGFADDRTVDFEGMKGDLPGELFQPNSQRYQADKLADPFLEGDAPLVDGERRPLTGAGLAPGLRVPGYLVEQPRDGRADVRATTDYRDGGWVVTLRRALKTGDVRDANFVPGDSQGVAFGLAVMDHTLFEHYASTLPERLLLLNEVQASALPVND